MKRDAIILAAILAFSGVYFLARSNSQPTVTVTNAVTVTQVQRMGVNLGTWSSWGSEQLSANILKNPGFEGNIDRAIVIVKHATPGRFTDDQNWLGRPNGFWIGAHYDVRSGSHAGETGVLADSKTSDGAGYPVYASQDSILLSPGDVVALTRADTIDLPYNWWFNQSAGASYAADVAQKRPGSPGARSVRLRSTNAALAQADSYMDAIGERAGKLLPLRGEWKLAFWAKLDSGQSALRVSLKREGSPAFFTETIPLTRSWQRFEFTFNPDDSGPAGTLDLRFEVQGAPDGSVLLDDSELRRLNDGPGAFRQEVRAVLDQLHPAYLRDWEGQLGDSFANRIAEPQARQTTRYRPGDASQADYSYGLAEFLELSALVNASPWIVVPTTFSDSECGQLGAYLNAGEGNWNFHEVLVEFGNENWNMLFRPAGIPEPVAHGQAADRCLGAIRRAAGPLPLRTVINAQHANPSWAIQFATASSQSDIVAVAPYFMPSLNTGIPTAQALPLLFTGDGGELRSIATAALELQKETGVYEVNLTTDGGSATDAERIPVTSGEASASALAITMLDALAAGVRRQCSYVLAGFDNQSAAPNGFVRLFGVTRDLATAQHLRPTALGLSMVNGAIRGDLVRTESSDADIHSYGFRDNGHWSLILVSSSEAAKSVRVRFPENGALASMLSTMVPDSAYATNEDGEHVRVKTSATRYSGRITDVWIPAYGLVSISEDAR